MTKKKDAEQSADAAKKDAEQVADNANNGLVTIKVQGPPRGMWRCGFKFGPEPVEVDVTDEQRIRIEADPWLKIIAT